MADYDDVLGAKAPKNQPQGSGQGGGYSHWCKPGSNAGDFQVGNRAYAENKQGLQGKDNPYVPYQDRERGDKNAPGRDNKGPGMADPEWFTDIFKGDK